MDRDQNEKKIRKHLLNSKKATTFASLLGIKSISYETQEKVR